MPSQVHGIISQPIAQIEETGGITKSGLDVITRVEKLPQSGFPNLVRKVGSIHPRFTSMKVVGVTWSRSVKFYRVEYRYEGYLLAKMEEPSYSLQGTLSEDLIQLHPDFVTTLAGKPSAPLNNAQWVDPKTEQVTTDDEKGVFREFKVVNEDGSQNPKAGIENFLSPGLLWVKTYVSESRPSDLTKLGKIDSPEGPCPNVAPRNWLFYSCNYTERGGVYEITKQWLMSGRYFSGWDEDIY